MVDWRKTSSYLLTIDRKRNILKGNVKEERQFMWSVYRGWTQLLFWEENQFKLLFSCWSRLKTCFISSSSMNCICNCSVSHFLMFQYIQMDCGLTSGTFSPLFSDYVDSVPSGDPCFNMTDPDQQMCLGYLGPLYQDNPISAETACQWVFHWIADLMILVPLCHQTLLSHNCVCNGYWVLLCFHFSFLSWYTLNVL